MRPARTRRAALIAAALLVLAGCGDSSSGGLGSSTPTATAPSAEDVLTRDVRAAERAAQAAPRDADALARLIRLRFHSAGLSRNVNSFTAAGKAELRRAAADWSRYLWLARDAPDAQVASLMVQAFGVDALDDPRRAARAQAIVVAQHRPPNSNLYAQLAVLHYRAGQRAARDRAADRAVRLARRADRAPLRRALRQLRSRPASRER